MTRPAEDKTRKRRWGRLAFRLGVGACVLLVLAVVGVVYGLRGRPAGRLVTGILAGVLPGKMKVEAVHWQGRLLSDLFTDAPTPIVLEGVELHDPEGTLVLALPRLELAVPPRSAMKAKVRLHDVKIGPGSYWRFGDQKEARGIGFLAALIPESPPDRPPAEKRPRPAAEPEPGFLFEIVNADLDGLTAEFDFPGSWGLRLANILGKANLVIDGDFVGWDAWDLDARDGGYLVVLTERLPFDRVEVARVATLREYRNDIFLEVAAGRSGRSVLTGKGFFTHIYDDAPPGIDMHAEMAHAADALNAVAAPHLPDIGPLRIAGDDAAFAIDLSQPFERIEIAGGFSNLEVDHGGRTARDLDFELAFAAAPLSARLPTLTFRDPEGGRFALTALFEDRAAPGQPSDMHLEAGVRLEDFRTRSYLPPGLVSLLGGRADGKLSARAALATSTVEANLAKLRLRRDRAAGLPRTITVSGQASASPELVETRGLRVGVPGANVKARGRVDLARSLMSLSIKAVAGKLPALLSSFGVPALAERAEVDAQVAGSFSNPSVRGRARVLGAGLPGNSGVPGIPRLDARFALRDGVARLDELQGALLGGALTASGQARLYRGSLENMLKAPLVEARVRGEKLRIDELVAQGLVKGALSFAAEAEGPVNRLSGRLELPDDTELVLLGQGWKLSGLRVTVDERALTLSTTRLQRDQGGALVLEGRLSLRGPPGMQWRVRIEDFPLAGVPGVAAAGLPLGGTLSADLEIGGSLAQPTAAGTITLDEVAVNGARLGDVDLRLQARGPAGRAGVDVEGRVFDLFTLQASAGLTPAGPDATATLAFTDLALETLLPTALAALQPAAEGDAPSPLPEAAAGVRSQLTGEVTVVVSPQRPLLVDARLSRLWLSGEAPAAQGEGRRVSLRNEGDIRARLEGERVTLEKSRLVTDGGELELGGTLAGQEVSAGLRGQLDLEVLQPLLAGVLKELGGALVVGLKVSGKLPRPTLEGNLAITRPVRLRHPALDVPIEVPAGVVRLRPHGLELERFSVRVEESQLALAGKASFADDYAIETFAVDASGTLDARLLALVAPEAVSESSGRLDIQGKIAGTPAAPDLDARLSAKNVTMRLRALGHRLALETADVKLASREVVLTNVRAVVDDEGVITVGTGGAEPGRIVFERLVPDVKVRYASLPIRGEHLSFRSPGVFEIDDLGFTLRLTGDLSENMALAGDVRVISGRVVWDFDVGDYVISPRIVEGYGPPPKPNPLIDNMRLDLNVRTIGDTFLVQNNIAPEMYMLIDLYVGGTAGNPTISGGLQPTDGRFHIIGMRGDFDLVPGTNFITFEPTKSVDELETPWLNLEAENVVIDTSGNEHAVKMRITGPVGQAQVAFSTDTGLTQNQALLLLLSGSPTAGDARFGSSNPTLTRNVNTGLDIAGQAARDVMSTLLEPYIADTLSLLTGDRLALRPTIGPDGVEVRLFGRFSRQLRLQLNYLQGFQNQRRARADAGLWVADYFTLRAIAEHLQLAPQQGITETFNSMNLEFSVEYPLRFPR